MRRAITLTGILVLVLGIVWWLDRQASSRALIRAVEHQSVHRTEELLRQGADPNTKGKFGQPAITIATEVGNPDIVRVLIGHGADISVTDQFNFTPLMTAAMMGRTQLVQLLLEHGADPSRAGEQGLTPLMVASREGHVDVVSILLHAGADVNAIDRRFGYSAQQFASKGRRPSRAAIQKLLQMAAKRK